MDHDCDEEELQGDPRTEKVGQQEKRDMHHGGKRRRLLRKKKNLLPDVNLSDDESMEPLVRLEETTVFTISSDTDSD